MPQPKNPNVIDGLASIRAARRAGETGHGRKLKTRPSQTRLSDADKPREGAHATVASRIGSTAVPPRHDLLCYECGYAFVIRGRIHKPLCPKCRCSLSMEDLCIRGEWSGNVKTIGSVEVTPDGRITEGSIVARDLVLEGDARGGRLSVGRCLELGARARYSPRRTTFRDMRIRPGARITLRHKVACRNLDIEGRLKASVTCEGMVRIKAGGVLEGALQAPHLEVEEGGGLRADIAVRPQDPPQSGRKEKNHGR